MTDLRNMTTGEAEAYRTGFRDGWRGGYLAAKHQAAALVECGCLRHGGKCVSPGNCAQDDAAAIRDMEPGE